MKKEKKRGRHVLRLVRKGKEVKKVVALDLGSITGFAVRSKHGVSHGTMSFKKKGKFHDSGFKALYSWLNTFSPFDELELVVEKPHAGRFMGAVRILFGLLAIVHLFADEHGIALTEVSPKAIKKHCTGNGNADKTTMLAHIQVRHPSIKDHNTADAVALLEMYLEGKC